jgi:hypothetical protein
VAHNPHGPNVSYDPEEPGEKKKVQHGDSFLGTDQYCSRYVVGTRGKGEVGIANLDPNPPYPEAHMAARSRRPSDTTPTTSNSGSSRFLKASATST